MRKVYIGNLPPDTDEKGVEQIFAGYGEIQSVGIPENPTGDGNRFAFVELNDDAAARALDELNGKEIDGHKLIVNDTITGTTDTQARA